MHFGQWPTVPSYKAMECDGVALAVNVIHSKHKLRFYKRIVVLTAELYRSRCVNDLVENVAVEQ